MVYCDRNFEELITEMVTHPGRCMRITENEMKTLLGHGGQILSVQESRNSCPESFWVEVWIQDGYFFADCKTDPRPKP